ncbi:rust resistance kinase Lr10-like [Malania oleifera]|uniref:rust resistance kinase Lr10-like n=1 Tax=Malania oleifera TaxID=397392 RepID=UPI0025AECB2A|nr:rust resistance kinase Lr10-like [Malania oleifera]
MEAKSIAIFISLLTALELTPTCRPQNDDSISSSYYDFCKPFNCGNYTFSFPFSSETDDQAPLKCGLPLSEYMILCENSTSRAALNLGGARQFRVKQIFPTEKLITVVDDQLITDLNSSSCESLQNLPPPPRPSDIAPLELSPLGVNLTFLKCSISHGGLVLDGVLANYSCGEGVKSFYLRKEVNRLDGYSPPLRPAEVPSGCEFVAMPVSTASLTKARLLNDTKENIANIVLVDGFGVFNKGERERRRVLADIFSDGFSLQWPSLSDCENCRNRGGRCGYDSSSRLIDCFCEGGCDSRQRKQKRFKSWKLIVGVATGSSTVVLATIFLIFKYKRKTSPFFKIFCFGKNQNIDHESKSAEEFIEEYRSTLLSNYSYNDIKKITNGFKDKLGRGGYGSVYKGNLSDGRTVAVKVLENSNDISHDFINEVTTIGTIHHINIIRLLGFCWDGSKQALIYEYMPNGSLGDLLSKKGLNHSVGLERLLEIALGVAHGIEYLHYGCGSRILHLDIKPQNVLLDRNFNPKISDFGLAKAYSRTRSVVTMTGARGTIGYIAPEIFLRSFGKPSEKSDVYSYGMLLLEMVGAKEHGLSIVMGSSEAQFPGWIYDKLIEEQEMVLIDSVVREEEYIARKMAVVGLWCIQMNPKDRPSMRSVVEMLSGSVEAIEMPPKPFLCSPPRVQSEHTSHSIDSSVSMVEPLASENLVT